ncbi:MAG: hypothetical protein V1907_01300 [Candidatus Kerfeldbacteria bacterium]
MSGCLPQHARRIIEAPLQLPGGRALVGDALWLYVMLAARANYRGVVCRPADRLALDLGLEEEQLAGWLERLSNADLIEVHTPTPYLVIKLKAWSDSNHVEHPSSPDSAASSSEVHREVPVSSAAAAAKQQEDGGQGEGEALLDEVLAVLGPDADRDEFRTLLSGRNPSLVHRALKRVQATTSIRVSRAALFRSLLRKLS